MTRCSECSALVAPIVAWDIDGTLSEYHRHLYGMICSYYSIMEPRTDDWDGRDDYERWMDLSRDAYRDAKLAFRQGGFKRWAPSFPGIEDANYIMEVYRHTQQVEVWITTTRPWNRMDNVDPDTRHWLNLNFPCYDHLLYGDDKYWQLARIVDPSRVVLIVEDLPDKYEQAVDQFGIEVPLLIERPHNQWYRNHEPVEPHTVNGLKAAAYIAEQRILEWHKRNDSGS